MKNLIYIAILFFLTSCGIYTPTSINTPLFKEKGQTAISATIGSGINLQYASALSNHLAILANTSVYGIGDIGKVKRPWIQLEGQGYFNEMAVGYFANHKKITYFELFGGFGRNRVNTTELYLNPKSNDYLNLKYKLMGNKLFLQPSIGWQSKNAEIVFTSRISLLNYNLKLNEIPDSLYLKDKLYFIDKRTFSLIEPAITLRVGPKNLKLQLQFGWSINLGKNKFTENTHGIISIGLFSKFTSKRKPTLNVK